MPRWSRRRALLEAATAGSLVFAGCSGESSHSASVPPDRGDMVSDIEVIFARNPDGERIFAIDDETDDRPGGFDYLTDDADRDNLTFRSTSAASELQEFVNEIDLESESVFLLQRPIGECYRANLVGVYRESDGVRADFCQSLRPADVDCSAEQHDTIGVAIRLPFPGDDFNSHGSGWSGSCDRRPIIASEGGVDR